MCSIVCQKGMSTVLSQALFSGPSVRRARVNTKCGGIVDAPEKSFSLTHPEQHSTGSSTSAQLRPSSQDDPFRRLRASAHCRAEPGRAGPLCVPSTAGRRLPVASRAASRSLCWQMKHLLHLNPAGLSLGTERCFGRKNSGNTYIMTPKLACASYVSELRGWNICLLCGEARTSRSPSRSTSVLRFPF